MILLLAWPSVAWAEDMARPLMDQAEDVGDSFQVTQDGGFIVVSTMESSEPGGNDVWLIKTDAQGNETWRKGYSFGPGEDDGASVLQTRDGGYAVAGYTNSTGSSYDALLLKIDSAGNMLWNKTYSLGAGNDIGGDVRETKDGYIIAGRTGSKDTGGKDVLLSRLGWLKASRR